MSTNLHGVDVLIGAHVAVAEDIETIAEQVIAEVESVAPLPTAAPVLKSEIPGVSDEAWTAFALAMKTQAPTAISASNELGMFALRPRRLADLGLMTNLRSARSSTGRMAWTGDWVKPMTEKKFLGSAVEQYKVFGASMRKYIEGLEDGSVAQPEAGLPNDVSLSGALAVLHRCGPRGLVNWQIEENRFPETVALFDAANGIF